MVVRAGFRPQTEISTAKFYYRAQQHVDFYFVELAANALGDARAVVPIPAPGTTHIEYFIELVTPDFTAIRSEPTVVPVGDAQACREQDPSMMLYSGENPNMVVGATRAGVPQITPGFQARGMVDFISISGGVTTTAAGGGVGRLPIILGGIGAGGAIYALSGSGGDETPNNPNPPIGGGSTTITVPTTTSVTGGGGGPTTTSVAGGGGPTTTTVTGASTSVPLGTTTTGGPTTTTGGPTTTTGGPTTTTGGPTTTTGGPTTTTGGPTTTTGGPTTTTGGPTTTIPTTTIPTTSVPSTTTNPTTTTTTGTSADIVVTKVDLQDPVTVNTLFTYRITVRNNGPANATGVVLQDDLPAGMSAQAANAPCGLANPVICSLGSISAGATRTVDILVFAQSVGVHTNNVSAGGGQNDPNLSNNFASESTSVASTLRTLDATNAVDLVFRSHIELDAVATAVRGRVVINGSSTQEIGSDGVHVVHVRADAAENYFEAYLQSGLQAEGIWHFDFAGTANFVLGSLRAAAGHVVSSDGHSISFAVGDGLPVPRFAIEIRDPGWTPRRPD